MTLPQKEEKINTKINFGSGAFKKYFANTSWLFAERIIRILINFIVTVYIVRYLGPKDFGLLSYAISFVALFATIATIGLDNIVVRELVKNPDKKNYLLGTAFGLRLAGAISSILLIVLTVFSIHENSFDIWLILIISLTNIFQSFNVVDFYFQSKVLSKFSVIVQSLSLIISSIIKILLMIFKYQLIYFAVATTLESFLLALGFIIVYRINGEKIFNWKFDKLLSISLFKDSWPLILSGIAIAVYMKIDQVMLKYMLNDVEVGYYAVAVKLSESWYFIPVAIVSSLFPAIINAKGSDEKLYKSRLQKLYDLLALISIGIALPVTFLSKFIISILFGNSYLPSAPVLTIYIWAGVSVFLGVATNQFLVTENFTRLIFYRTFAGMILNVILNLILIPVMGITGSAVATLLSYSLSGFFMGFSERILYQYWMVLKAILLLDVVFFTKNFLFLKNYDTKKFKK
jgi:O-antigen/teichoic acid export membrane protein